MVLAQTGASAQLGVHELHAGSGGPGRVRYPGLATKLTQHPVLAAVPVADVHQLIEGSFKVVRERGEHLWRAHDAAPGYWLIYAGAARVEASSARGRQRGLTLQLLGAPSAWGEHSAFGGAAADSCTALEQVRALHVPTEHFLRMLERSPRFAQNVLRDAAARCALANRHKQQLASMNSLARLCHLLASYVDLTSVETPHGQQINGLASQRGLAGELGVALKSASRAVVNLSRNGVLRRHGGSWLVQDVAALRAHCPRGVPGLQWVSPRLSDSTVSDSAQGECARAAAVAQ